MSGEEAELRAGTQTGDRTAQPVVSPCRSPKRCGRGP